MHEVFEREPASEWPMREMYPDPSLVYTNENNDKKQFRLPLEPLFVNDEQQHERPLFSDAIPRHRHDPIPAVSDIVVPPRIYP
jgi:hypothetical protein